MKNCYINFSGYWYKNRKFTINYTKQLMFDNIHIYHVMRSATLINTQNQ